MLNALQSTKADKSYPNLLGKSPKHWSERNQYNQLIRFDTHLTLYGEIFCKCINKSIHHGIKKQSLTKETSHSLQLPCTLMMTFKGVSWNTCML